MQKPLAGMVIRGSDPNLIGVTTRTVRSCTTAQNVERTCDFAAQEAATSERQMAQSGRFSGQDRHRYVNVAIELVEDRHQAIDGETLEL